jgi:hypothetical protein
VRLTFSAQGTQNSHGRLNACARAPVAFRLQVRLALAGKGPLNGECYLHPGRKGCKVEKLLADA